MATFAERLSLALVARNMTAAELSRALGINEGTISQYKSGAYEPKQKRTQAIAQILNVSIDWLMGADVPMQERAIITTTDDEELQEYLEELRNRSEMRMLFKTAKNSSKEDIEKTVKIIEALKGQNE